MNFPLNQTGLSKAMRDARQVEPVRLLNERTAGENTAAPPLVIPASPDPSAELAPPLLQNAAEMGALKPLPSLPDARRGLLSTIAACAGHAVLVFAAIYAVGSAGHPDQESENPIEIEIVVEPTAQAAPEIAPEPVIEIELPPPLPDPVIDLPVALPEKKPEPVPEAETAPEPPPEQQPDVTFEPPPPAKTPDPELALPKPVQPALPKIDPEKQRQQEIARQKMREERLRQQQREAREDEREKSRKAAQEKTRQQARAVAQRQAAQVQAGRAASPPSAGARGDSAMSINAFKAAVAARIARNKPAGSIAAAAQGTVVVTFSVTSSGGAAGIRIASSSGHGVLDQAALAAVRRASPFPAPPPGAPRSFSVPMRFNAR